MFRIIRAERSLSDVALFFHETSPVILSEGVVFSLRLRFRRAYRRKQNVCARYELLSNFLSRCPGSRGPEWIREKRCYIDYCDWISPRGSSSHPWALHREFRYRMCITHAWYVSVLWYFSSRAWGNDVTCTCIETLDGWLRLQDRSLASLSVSFWSSSLKDMKEFISNLF